MAVLGEGRTSTLLLIRAYCRARRGVCLCCASQMFGVKKDGREIAKVGTPATSRGSKTHTRRGHPSIYSWHVGCFRGVRLSSALAAASSVLGDCGSPLI